MTAATVLHVGDDLCHRLPVMEHAGFVVHLSECSVHGIRTSLTAGTVFSAITFHSDVEPPPELVVSTTRSLSLAPLLLFENPLIGYEEAGFDYVIPGHTSPFVWLKSLEEAIRQAQNLRAKTQQLRIECQNVRSETRRLRANFARIRQSPIRPDALWPKDDGKR